MTAWLILGAVTAAARAASRRFVAFDMAALAEEAGSVVSSVLFGALGGAGVLPFGRPSFEATIAEAGVGVSGSLRGFALGFDAVGEAPDVVLASAAAVLAPVGHAPYDELLTRAAALPEAAHETLAEGLRLVVGYQDIAYGKAYLDIVELMARHGRPNAPLDPLATVAAAKYVARAMAFDDVIRVAALKTQPSRAARVEREMGGQVIGLTEFMHPRMEELLGLLPRRLGEAVERHTRLVALLERLFCGPRRIRTDTISGFLLLYFIAGLRGWRSCSLRYYREWVRIHTWIGRISNGVPDGPRFGDRTAGQPAPDQRIQRDTRSWPG